MYEWNRYLTHSKILLSSFRYFTNDEYFTVGITNRLKRINKAILRHHAIGEETDNTFGMNVIAPNKTIIRTAQAYARLTGL